MNKICTWSTIFLLITSIKSFALPITTVDYDENQLGFRWLFNYDLPPPANVPNAMRYHPTIPHEKWDAFVSFQGQNGKNPPTLFVSGQHLINPTGHSDGMPAPRLTFFVHNPISLVLTSNIHFNLAGNTSNNITGTFPVFADNLTPTSTLVLHNGVKHGKHFDLYSLLRMQIGTTNTVQYHFQGIHTDETRVTVPEPATIAIFSLGLLGLRLNRRRQRKAA
jgi:hypothetical protein